MRTSNQKKLIKIITMPIRVLKKGKDMYIKSMMGVAQKPRYGSTNMKGSLKKVQSVSSGLPKSLSTSAASSRSSTLEPNQDLRDLIRANSTSGIGSLDVDLYMKQLIKEEQMKKLKELMERNNFSKSKSLRGGVPRSCSVVMGRIDEDKAYEFEEEEVEELGSQFC
ncbi:hypothetical protein ACET3Z_010050 [Daucus carota]